MLGEKHNLEHEFPDHIIEIAKLKSDNPEFAKLAREYHKLSHTIYGLEVNDVPTTDERFKALKGRRVELKDLIYKKLINGEF